jgi:hypothetical protein
MEARGVAASPEAVHRRFQRGRLVEFSLVAPYALGSEQPDFDVLLRSL